MLTRAKKRGSEASEVPPNILLQSSLALETGVDSGGTSVALRSWLSGAEDNNSTTPFPLLAEGGGAVFAGSAARALLVALPSEMGSKVCACLPAVPQSQYQ